MSAEIHAALLQLKQGLSERRRSAVNDAARDLIAAKADLGTQWRAVATALQRNGEWNLAIAATDLMVEQTGNDPASRYGRANILYQAGRHREALAELDAIERDGFGPRTDDHKVSNLNSRASMHLLLGDTASARIAVDEALALDPRSGQAWLTLSEFGDFRSTDKDKAEALESAFAAGASLPSEATKLAHATARLRHQMKDYEGAFRAYERGAQEFLAHSSKGGPVDVLRVSTSFGADLIERVQSQIRATHDRVIFVTGLPRSGTTLVEQVLVSHPDVQHGEELNLFRIIGQEIGGLDGPSFSAWLDKGNDPNDLVELYLHLASERFGPEGRFVDKTIEGGNYMGLLLALFPKAPIFWLHRDPIDNGFSAFRTMFGGGARWSWRLEHVGQRLAQEERMIAHWYATAGDRIAFVDYEKLVRDPETHIPRIAAAAGLELTDSMLRPHETQRTVATASVSQVREPINLKGIGVADPYRPWLGPMIDAYEAASVSEGSSAPG